MWAVIVMVWVVAGLEVAGKGKYGTVFERSSCQARISFFALFSRKAADVHCRTCCHRMELLP